MPSPHHTPAVREKRCPRCQQSFPRTPDYFHINRAIRDGLSSKCKACACQATCTYYATHTAKRQAYSRAYYAKHRATACAKHRVWYTANATRVSHYRRARYQRHRAEERASNRRWLARHAAYRTAYHRAYRLSHTQEIRRKKLLYRLTHAAQLRLAGQRWRLKNQTRIALRRHLYDALHKTDKCLREASRRARKRGATINDLTTAQWHAMQHAYGHRCAYCNREMKGHLTQDHLTPLSRGGNHTYTNIVPACRGCNSRKHTGPPLVPVQPMLLLA